MTQNESPFWRLFFFKKKIINTILAHTPKVTVTTCQCTCLQLWKPALFFIEPGLQTMFLSHILSCKSNGGKLWYTAALLRSPSNFFGLRCRIEFLSLSRVQTRSGFLSSLRGLPAVPQRFPEKVSDRPKCVCCWRRQQTLAVDFQSGVGFIYARWPARPAALQQKQACLSWQDHINTAKQRASRPKLSTFPPRSRGWWWEAVKTETQILLSLQPWDTWPAA